MTTTTTDTIALSYHVAADTDNGQSDLTHHENIASAYAALMERARIEGHMLKPYQKAYDGTVATGNLYRETTTGTIVYAGAYSIVTY